MLIKVVSDILLIAAISASLVIIKSDAVAMSEEFILSVIVGASIVWLVSALEDGGDLCCVQPDPSLH